MGHGPPPSEPSTYSHADDDDEDFEDDDEDKLEDDGDGNANDDEKRPQPNGLNPSSYNLGEHHHKERSSLSHTDIPTL